MSKNKIVTLLTDFGTEDGYVGAMKGVLLKLAPQATVIDISHEITPFDVREAAFVLLNYAGHFPAGTVHVVVVDPGVGTKRKGIIVQTRDYYFIGPDNGVFSLLYDRESFQASEIKEETFGGEVSHTFHGRDIFAPAAARLLNGEKIEAFAKPVSTLSSFTESFEKRPDGSLLLKVQHIDHFGNLILNFTRADWQGLGQPAHPRIKIQNSFLFGIRETFGDAGEGQLLAVWDSSGFLQIAQNQGNAAKILQIKVGDIIILKL